jgi:hypothetical protein
MLVPRTFRTKLGLAPALAALLLIARAPAQESSPEAAARSATAAPQVEEEIVVRGRRLGEIDNDLRIYIRDFLDQVAAPARARGYARWDRRVCVGVHNLQTDAAQYIVDRISLMARDVGVEPGEPGCRPQVNIIFTADAGQLSADMVEREPGLFRPAGGYAGMDLGREALAEFVRSDKAVRWWHVSAPVDAHTGNLAIDIPSRRMCGDMHCPPYVNVQGPSRIHSGTTDELQYVIVIVDPTKLTGTTWQQIADYLGVVSLAQIDPRTDPKEFDSILNLFSNPAAYSGLTDWDRSYLEALYAIDLERVPNAQANQIVSRIARGEIGVDE